MEPIIPVVGISIWLIAKIFALFALFIYVLFSLVVIRQVRLMIETLDVGLGYPLKLASYAHFILSILVFIFSLITL